MRSGLSLTSCLMGCLAEKCTSVEMDRHGSVCRIHRGNHLYRVPLVTNIVYHDGHILYQQKGITFT